MTENVSDFTKYLISHFYCNIYTTPSSVNEFAEYVDICRITFRRKNEHHNWVVQPQLTTGWRRLDLLTTGQCASCQLRGETAKIDRILELAFCGGATWWYRNKVERTCTAQIYPTMSTTVSKVRLKVDIVSINKQIIQRFRHHPSDEVSARHVNRDDLYHFYASLSFSESVYSFAAMIGAPECIWERHPGKTRRLVHAKFTPKIDLRLI